MSGRLKGKRRFVRSLAQSLVPRRLPGCWRLSCCCGSAAIGSALRRLRSPNPQTVAGEALLARCTPTFVWEQDATGAGLQRIW